MKKKTKLLIGTALICPLLLALILVVALVVVPHFTNKFRIDVVDDISLGASKEEVRTKLGDPYLEEKTRWGYGDKKLCSYLEDAQDISAAMEEAILRGDLERVERLNRQYENLMNEVASKKFSYIEVNFEDDAVVSVLLDKAYALDPGFKKVKEDKLTWSGGKSIVLPYYIDYTRNSDGELRELDCELGDGLVAYSGKELSCATTFTDGSYFHAYVKSYEVKDDGYIVWSDAYVDHEARKPNGFSAPTSSLGTISADGTWRTWSSNIKFKSITIPANVTSIGEGAFKGCSFTSIEIPDSVTSIGRGAFEDCNRLISVIWNAENCTKAGSYNYPIFQNCTNLNTVTFGENVKTIPAYAFSSCKGLTSVTIGSGVTSIGNYAFYGCSGLTSIVIPDSVTSIGNEAFANTAYYKEDSNWTNGVLYIGNHLIKAKTTISGAYTIKSGTKTIADDAFDGCSSLTSITIPDSVTSIGGYAFSGCDKIESATMPTLAISYIPKTSLQTVVLTSGDSIGRRAFYGCSGLKSVTIGSGVTSIEDCAFYECEGLTSITIPDSVISIGNYAFYECEGLTSITIPDSVTSIGDYAFSHCSGLTSIVIPDSVTSIGEGAFEYCSGLTGELKIPDSVTSIGKYAFYWCSGLKSVTIGSGVTSIEDCAFYNCSGLESVAIGSGVTSIGKYAFEYCSGLESVTIGSSVTSIGGRAFYNCSGLKTIYYQGTAETWKKISINSDNSNLTYATRYYFTENKPTAEEWAEWNYWWHYDPETGEPTPWIKENQ